MREPRSTNPSCGEKDFKDSDCVYLANPSSIRGRQFFDGEDRGDLAARRTGRRRVEIGTAVSNKGTEGHGRRNAISCSGWA